MISPRYHVVSIAAVFLALALGIVLGSAAPGGTALLGDSDATVSAGRAGDLKAERDMLAAKAADLDAFAGSVGPTVVGGLLDARSVVLVSTHDADSSARDALAELISQAGATVTGEVRLADSFTDPADADRMREIVTRLQPAGVRLPVDGDSGALAGALLGSVLLLDGGSAQPQSSPDERTAVLAGLREGGFLAAGQAPAPARLAVVLTGGQVEGDRARARATTLATFATQLDRSGAGVVLAGAATSARETGPVGAARADAASTTILSTVDNVDTAAGRVAVVLALREQLDGRAGRYGMAGDAQALVPGADGSGG